MRWSTLIGGGLFLVGVVLLVGSLVASAAKAQRELTLYRSIAKDPIVLQRALDVMDANDRAMDLILTSGGRWNLDGIAVSCQRVAVNVY